MTTPDRDETLARLLALGVPYYLALEAVSSTALDRDDDVGTQQVTDQPAWLHETPDGLEIRDRD